MILSAGESLIDMVPEGANYRPLPGGAVYNTAIALGRMGADTGYLWPIRRCWARWRTPMSIPRFARKATG
ncbi:MAG TPA: hypothetical protein PLI13_05225 [Paracoccus sp. (in: a-proteobacteria)]|nr:hypothetical protein [Paracoccus sp. (in: a-proteobacteria)]